MNPPSRPPSALNRLAGVVLAALTESHGNTAHIQSVVSDSIDAYVQTRARTGALPPELLVHILHFLPLSSQIRAALVCKRWRALSLSNPAQLWSTVVVRGGKKRAPGTLLALLDRSGDVDITMDLTVASENAYEISLALTRHLGHTHRLALWVDTEVDGRARGHLRKALEAPAPRLRDIALWEGQGAFDASIQLRWFGGTAPPMLQRAKLYLRSLVAGTFIVPTGLTSLTRLLYAPHNMSTIDFELAALLSALPALDTLALEVTRATPFVPAGDDQTLLQPQVFGYGVLERLESLDTLALVAAHDEAALYPFAVPFASLRSRSLVLSWPEARGIASISMDVHTSMLAVLAETTNVEALTIHYSSGLNIDVRDAKGRERTFLEVPRHMIPSSAIFAQITTLSVAELAWAHSNSPDEVDEAGMLLAAAPNLLDLTVFLLRPTSHIGTLAHRSAFFLPRSRFSGHTLSCPNLRTVSFVSRASVSWESASHDIPTMLDPTLIETFLTYRLSYSSAVLEELRFVGVKGFVSVLSVEIARLFGMARRVEIERTRPSDLRPVADMLSWKWP
ncbi:hypothetical protein EXIGLDRAFT_718400 [Exidia glandulosa HHB12029]|uniref:F-box domain-containing protein n=1 Tax=Exidia glandulosa HHB12029 TaxID=1314781 RepID=A0A165HSR7_EXIGL|nr:hypothetical protein EXIGLDRAFT_718400 [Exidia glandulosa HHB12029]